MLGGQIGRPTNPWLAFFLAPVAVLIGTIAGAVLLAALPSPGGAVGFTIELVALFLPTAMLIWVWRSRFEKGDLASLGLGAEGSLRLFGRGYLVGVVMFSAVVGVLAVLGMMETDPTPMANTGMAALGGLVVVLIGWTVQATTEEVVARGWLMTTMAARSNAAIAVVASSLLFALLHLFNDNVSLIAMANIFLVGVFLAGYALWEKGLWGVSGLHTSWNMAQANFFGLQVSGNDLSFGSLLDLDENGPGLLTGDAFGPEAGLVATGVVVIGLVSVAWLRRASSADTTL